MIEENTHLLQIRAHVAECQFGAFLGPERSLFSYLTIRRKLFSDNNDLLLPQNRVIYCELLSVFLSYLPNVNSAEDCSLSYL